MRIIGLNGRLHSGKDTAVEFIEEVATGNVQRAAFADKLKLSAARSLGFPGGLEDAVDFCNDLKEDTTITVDGPLVNCTFTGREYLQWYGTEAHRGVFGSNFWIDALLPEDAFPDVDVLVITDVRFPNEANHILNLGGDVWYINAEERLGPLPEDAHVSEHPLPDGLITFTVYNNGTFNDYRYEIHEAFHAYDNWRG